MKTLKPMTSNTEFGQLIAQSRENARRIDGLEISITAIGGKIDSLVERINVKTTPNYGVFWTAAGVVVVIVIALCGSLFYYFNTRFMLQDSAAKESYSHVDTRLQLVENERSRKAERYDDLIQQKLIPTP